MNEQAPTRRRKSTMEEMGRRTLIKMEQTPNCFPVAAAADDDDDNYDDYG